MGCIKFVYCVLYFDNSPVFHWITIVWQYPCFSFELIPLMNCGMTSTCLLSTDFYQLISQPGGSHFHLSLLSKDLYQWFVMAFYSILVFPRQFTIVVFSCISIVFAIFCTTLWICAHVWTCQMSIYVQIIGSKIDSINIFRSLISNLSQFCFLLSDGENHWNWWEYGGIEGPGEVKICTTWEYSKFWRWI